MTSTPAAGDLYRDRDGRTLRLVDWVDPRGDVPPFWRVTTVDQATGAEGRRSTVRADRLDHDYTKVDQ